MARIDDASAEIYNAQQKFELCPGFKKCMWDFLDNEVAHERRTSVKMALELARRKDWATVEGDPFKVNNNLSPAIARLYLMEHPEAAPYIETRKAACDGMEQFA